MAHSWLRLVAGATLSFVIAGHALADEGKITVFAAASLTNAMQDIAAEYKKEKNVDVVSSFASSSTLARQIEAGARRICSSLLTRNGWITQPIKKRWIPRRAKHCLAIAWWW